MNTQTLDQKSITSNESHSLRGFFFIISVGFLIGDILGIVWDISLLWVLIAWVLGLSLIKKWRYWYLCIAISLFIGWMFGAHSTAIHLSKLDRLSHITQNFTQKVIVEWSIWEKLYKKAFSTVYRLDISKIDTIDISSTGTWWWALSIFIEIPSNLHIHNDDTIRFTGKIEKNIHFPLVWYDAYSFLKEGYGHISLFSYERVSSGKVSWLDSFRIYWTGVYRKYFPDSIAGTLMGMTIGSIDLLSTDVKNDFIKSGISHILVVSGSNIAFLILLLTFFLKYIPIHKLIRISIVIIIILMYGTLVWWWVSVIRAVIMGIISYLIVEYHGKWISQFSLLLAAGVLTLYNPLSIAYDAGFGLSFGATFGILIFHPYIEKYGIQFHIPKWIISLISITLGASLGSLPAMIYFFGNLPIGSLIANILIGGLLGWILFTAVFFVVIQFFGSFIGYIFWFLVYIPTHWILLIGDFFSRFPIINIPELWRWNIAIFLCWVYISIFFFTLGSEGTRNQKELIHRHEE